QRAEDRRAAHNDAHRAGALGKKPPLTRTFFSLDEANPIPAATMVPITVPIPGTIVPAAPPRSAPEIVRFLLAQALVCSHRSAGLVSAGLVSTGLVSAGLVLAFMLLPSVVFWKSAWMLAHPPHRRDVAMRPHRRQQTRCRRRLR